MNKETAPVISVLMPVYNAERYLREAIESVLTQTYLDFELVILNDGSTDQSSTIIASFQDHRIREITNETNLGLIATLNKGLNLCRGKFIARMDADDICMPDRLEKQLDFLQQNPQIGVLGTGVRVVDKEGKKISQMLFPGTHDAIRWTMNFFNPIAHPTVMIRKSVLGNDKYDVSFVHTEDYELWTRLIHKTRFHNLSESLLQLRKHDSNISHVFELAQLKSHVTISAGQMSALAKRQVSEAEVTVLLNQQAANKTTIKGAANVLLDMYRNEKKEKDISLQDQEFIRKDLVARMYTLLGPWKKTIVAWKILSMNLFLVPAFLQHLVSNRFLTVSETNYN